MIVVYDSLKGHGKEFAEKLGLATQAISEPLDQEAILVTRNEGFGEIAQATADFLDKNADKIIGVVVNGNIAKHADSYNFAADKIADKYGLKIIAKIDLAGTDEDVKVVKEFIDSL